MIRQPRLYVLLRLFATHHTLRLRRKAICRRRSENERRAWTVASGDVILKVKKGQARERHFDSQRVAAEQVKLNKIAAVPGNWSLRSFRNSRTTEAATELLCSITETGSTHQPAVALLVCSSLVLVFCLCPRFPEGQFGFSRVSRRPLSYEEADQHYPDSKHSVGSRRGGWPEAVLFQNRRNAGRARPKSQRVGRLEK